MSPAPITPGSGSTRNGDYRVFLVTGVSGAGKSTVARRLSTWGHRAVSLDGDSPLCSWAAPDGRRVARPAEPDAAWLAGHRWMWDPARLDEIISAACGDGAERLWLCGQAANAGELVGRFDAFFLLEIDQATMRHRMTAGAGRGNDFGRVGASLGVALAGYHEFVATWRRLGAVPVDAMQDVDRVCEDLLVAAAFAALNRPG